MSKLRIPAVLALALGLSTIATAQQPRPTIVLVHGAFAESSGWNGVIAELEKAGYRTVAAPNPLRSVASDAASVAALVASIDGPVVLVGHSYGGPVITQAAIDRPNVVALVYVAGFAPDVGESSLTLSAMFPGSTLGDALQAVPLADGGQDLFIQTDKFHAQFAADLPADQAALMAATQRPVTYAALAEPTTAAAWRSLPSYFVYGSEDLNIPPAVLAFMAERAQARETRVLEGASHAVMVSHPTEVARVIIDAARAR
jgi:pimeloyl-ACP methyl ester carboxylesterase